MRNSFLHPRTFTLRLVAAIVIPLAISFTKVAEGQVSVDRYAIVDTPTGPLAVYRLYVYSTGPFQLLAWGAQPGHPTVFSTTCKSPFFNPPGGGNGPPTQDMIMKNPMLEWDTFATIGLAIQEHPGEDESFVFPPWPPFIEGNTFSLSDHVIVVTPDSPQSYAVPLSPFTWRALVAQLTLSADEGIINANPLSMIGFLMFRYPDGTTSTLYDIQFLWATFVGRCCLHGAGGCLFVESAHCATIYGGQMIGCQPCTQCNNCYGDLAPPGGDSVVGVMDLLRVIEQWGPCWNCSGDIAPQPRDGVVGVPDLLAVINNWGACK